MPGQRATTGKPEGSFRVLEPRCRLAFPTLEHRNNVMESIENKIVESIEHRRERVERIIICMYVHEMAADCEKKEKVVK